MTTSKSKIVKEAINNIEQEQQKNRLNWEQKVDDWREKYTLQGKELEEVKEKLRYKNIEAETWKDGEKYLTEAFEKTLDSHLEEIEVLKKKLSEQDESKQVSLLKEQHEKEIRELKNKKAIVDENYNSLSRRERQNLDKINKLEEELERGEVLIEELREESKFYQLSDKANLDAIKVGIDFTARQKFLPEIEKLKDDLNNEREISLGFFKKLTEKTVEADKWHDSSEENYKELQKEIKKNKDKDETIRKLEEQLYLSNRPLPKRPSKLKILKEKTKIKFQNLIKKTKQQSQELIARIEVKVK